MSRLISIVAMDVLEVVQEIAMVVVPSVALVMGCLTFLKVL